MSIQSFLLTCLIGPGTGFIVAGIIWWIRGNTAKRLICFSDAIKGPLRQMFFVVLLPDGTVVEPRVAAVDVFEFHLDFCCKSARVAAPQPAKQGDYLASIVEITTVRALPSNHAVRFSSS